MTLIKSKLGFLVVILLILGLFFRFTNIDTKFYWYDEVFTSLRISGYTQTEVLHEISSVQLVGAQDLMKYQRSNPAKNFGDTVKGIAIEEPQLPPLYFLAVKCWGKLFGDSPLSTRSFSVWMSLLAFPALYWLCRELFPAPEVAWIAVGLLAVSPLHVLYAQEARPYSLWPVLILVSCASLLRAMRLQTKLSWSIYAVATILGFYTHLFSLLVALGHGIYVWGMQGYRLNRKVVNYVMAIGLSLVAFLPWMVILVINKKAAKEATLWANGDSNLLSLINNWSGNIGRVFWDFGLNSQATSINLIGLMAATLILLAIVSYAVYFLCCETKKQVWLFLLVLMAVTAVAVMLPDVILGGIRSTKPRYLFPTYLAMQISVAYLLATKISALGVPSWKRQMWKVLTVVLLTGSVLSNIVSSQAETWWTKELGRENPVIARRIDRAPKPLVVSDISEVTLGNILSMSHLLEPKVMWQLVLLDQEGRRQAQLLDPPAIPKIPSGFSDVFVYGRTQNFSAKLAKMHNSKIDVPKKQTIQMLWVGKLEKE
ncbi:MULTISPECIES: glycosyltransferase family 39 protein [unclassified Microcoleus]|uniref:glycosyltransferase family 39 protein n=1 Tax=unclassified Microcoleus TaxID=2642155 RepID=UPI0025F6BFFD|nr:MULTISPECIES: glycosyltransferase family 39 protein [unclassified Microcoleus]